MTAAIHGAKDFVKLRQSMRMNRGTAPECALAPVSNLYDAQAR